MYIKKIIISGFTSYKHTTVLMLDKGHNVIIGCNGSGKSNILKAVDFVLNPSRDKATGAIYSVGTAGADRKAIVELVFHNSSGTLSIAEAEVSVKRVVTERYNNYYLNNKKVSLNELRNVFDAMGLTQNVASFFIQEGQVNRIATGSDNYTLKLLQEASGSRQFDENLTALQQLESSDTCMDEVKIVFDAMTQRERELLAAVGALREYEGTRRDKLVIQHYINLLDEDEREERNQQLRNELLTLEWARDAAIPDLAKPNYEGNLLAMRMDALKMELRIREAVEEANKNSLRQMQQCMDACWKRQMRLRNEMATMQTEEDRRNKREAERERLQRQISEYEQHLNAAKAENEQLLTDEHNLDAASVEIGTQLNIWNKVLEWSRIPDEHARDSAIREELRIAKKRTVELKRYQKSIIEQQLQALNVQTEPVVTEPEKEVCERRLEIANRKRVQLIVRMHLLCEHASESSAHLRILDITWKTLFKELQSIECSLAKLAGKAFGSTLSMRKYLDARAIPIKGCLGRVVDVFTCDPKLYQAVVSSARDRLFAYIFETKETMKCVAEELLGQGKSYAGPIRMYALDHLDVPTHAGAGDGGDMLIDQLEFDEKFRALMRVIFGTTRVVDEIFAGTYDELRAAGAELRVDHVAMDGSFLDARGAFYKPPEFDAGHCVVHLAKQELHYSTQLRQIASDQKPYVSALVEIARHAVELAAQFDGEDGGLAVKLCTLIRDSAQRQAARVELQEARTAFEACLASCLLTQQSLRVTRRRLEEMLQEEFVQPDPVEAERALAELRAQMGHIARQRASLEARRRSLRYEALAARLKEAGRRLATLEPDACVEVAELRGRDLPLELEQQVAARGRLEQLAANCWPADGDGAAVERSQLQDAEKQWRMCERKKYEAEQAARVRFRQWDAILAEMGHLREQAAAAIGQLDICRLPADSPSVAKYADMGRTELQEHLRRCDRSLQSYAVDKDAYNMYAEFKVTHDKFKAECSRLQQVDRLIEDAVLPAYRDQGSNLLQQAFDKVAARFASIFQQLVPTGAGRLEMVTRDDLDDTERTPSDDASALAAIGACVGIRIKVSFAPGAEAIDLIRLSGGEKALVGAAYLLALQALLTTPFFIFDELDGALDVQYRANMARVIHGMSEGAQFVTVTHRPEQVQYADAIFGVRIEGNCSSVKRISLEEAAAYVETK